LRHRQQLDLADAYDAKLTQDASQRELAKPDPAESQRAKAAVKEYEAQQALKKVAKKEVSREYKEVNRLEVERGELEKFHRMQEERRLEIETIRKQVETFEVSQKRHRDKLEHSFEKL
jgi:hypothetical protein